LHRQYLAVERSADGRAVPARDSEPLRIEDAGLFEKSRLPIVLVVDLVIVIERSRKIDYEDDESEDESLTCLFKQPLRL